MALAGNTWDGGGGDDNWGTANNWSPDGAPGYGTISFAGTNRITNFNNSVTAMNQVNWNGVSAWTMNGSSTLSLFDNGGTQPKLESFGTGGVSINAPIVFAANNGGPPNPFGEINPVNSNINFTGSTLTVNGSSVNGIKFFGNAGKDVSFANTVSATGKWFGITTTNGISVTVASGGNVTIGDFYAMNGGTLNLSGGTLSTTAVRLGGDFGNTGNQNQTLGGTLALTPAAGGISFAGTINSVTGNTSSALLIDSQNTSGTNSLTGSIFLDSDLQISQKAGTLNTSAGTFDVKTRKLTVDVASGGTVNINQALTSTFGAGGLLVKSGPGTLNLTSTGNNYTGTTAASLNANGTQIAGGTLGIAGDTSLGVVPAGAYNNIQFTGTGSLKANAALTLNANRNISIASAQTATIDTNGNAVSVNGAMNGSGSFAKSGGGTLTLNGTSTYTGTTTVAQGTLSIATTGQIANSSSVLVNANATLNNDGLITSTLTVDGTLKGNGNIKGNTTVNGTLAPGASAGKLTWQTGSLTLGNVAATNLEVDGTARGIAGGYDAVDVNASSLTYDGTLTVNFSNTFGSGTNFNFFDFTSQTGNFDAVVLSGSYVTSLANNAGVWTGTVGATLFTFTTSNGVLSLSAVPEPLTAAGVLLLTGRVLGRRSRVSI